MNLMITGITLRAGLSSASAASEENLGKFWSEEDEYKSMLTARS